MGIISEHIAENNAINFQNILIKALNSKDKNVILFCKENIYPFYLEQVSDSYNVNLSKTEEFRLIKEEFSKK